MSIVQGQYVHKLFYVTGITQEQIDKTRQATEHQMLNDLKEFVSKGGDLEVRDHIGATMVI